MRKVIKLLEIIEKNYCYEVSEDIIIELLLFLAGLLKERHFRIIQNNCRKDTVLDLLGIGYVKILSNIFIYEGNEEEGIFCNDIIINGDEIEENNSNTMRIVRNGKVIEKKFVRANNNFFGAENKVIENEYWVYLKIENFTEEFIEKLKERDFKDKEIVIDLRNNMGGKVLLASGFLKLLVKSTEPIYFLKNRKGERAVYYRENSVVLENMIYVLVNRYTASSAELVTAVLREHRGAKIIGEKTYGKGTLVKGVKFTENSNILLPVYEFYTRSVKINGIGIMPDVIVEGEKIDDWIKECMKRG